ncbi:ABC transporter permease [Mycolicibacterium phlei]|jgi:ribose transport system permease protein
MTQLSATEAAATNVTALSQRVGRWLLAAILVALVAFSSLATEGFLTWDNLRAVLINTTTTGIVAVAITPLTLSGNLFTMAAGQTTMLASMILVATAGAGHSAVLGAVLALVVLIVIGTLQALAIAQGLNPIITTLAAGTIIYGAVTWLTGGRVLAAPDSIDWISTTSLFGLPLPVYVFLAFTGLMWFLCDATVVGRQITLLGANPDSARLSGVSPRALVVSAFVLMSVGMTIAGILSASELGQVSPDNLSTLTIDAVATILIGGTAIQGGEGSPLRSAVGALILVILQNVMLLHGLSTGARIFGEGLLVVLVITVLHVGRQVFRQ